jgi:hypothetical protein
MKKYFITFGGPSIGYRRRVKELTMQAENLIFFDRIIGFNDDILKQDVFFWSKHSNFIENNFRGYGYWIWKSYLVMRVLESMEDNDILLYCDAGCVLNPYGIDRLEEYFNIVSKLESGILNFHLEPGTHPNNDLFKEFRWTKNDLFNYLDLDSEHINSNQRISGIFLLRKCPNTINFSKKWYETSCNYNLIDDSPSIISNHETFELHRHDQSILSCLSKQFNGTSIADETYFHPNWEIDGKNYPIWAVRNRG